MKISSLILLCVVLVGIAGVFGSNYAMKKEYDKTDRSDPYWNFATLTTETFSHLVLNGGNITNIVYEESPNCYVKVMKSWRGATDGSVKSFVQNDTLYVSFANAYRDVYEKQWLLNVIPLRLAGPRLSSISAVRCKLIVERFSQKNLDISAAGGSKVLVNAYTNRFDLINSSQADSSIISLTMSRDLFVRDLMRINKLTVSGSGTSLLSIHSSMIESSDFSLTDSAAVAVNGYSINRMKKF
jgi:hypothetical protein